MSVANKVKAVLNINGKLSPPPWASSPGIFRFIPEDDAEPDEIEAIERAKDEIARVDYVSFASAAEMAAYFGIDLEE
jgi:hypothetical protein